MLDLLVRLMNWFWIGRTTGELYNFLIGFLVATLFWGVLVVWLLPPVLRHP